MLPPLLVGVLETPFGPVETPFEPSPGPFIALFGIGLMIAAAGHLFKSKLLVGTGLAMMFGATLLVPLFLYLGQGS
ncbi:MAG: hypothetical protein ACJ768_02065 [Gaiellaceae bacterium]